MIKLNLKKRKMNEENKKCIRSNFVICYGIFTAISGCGSMNPNAMLAESNSGFIGCPIEAITIEDYKLSVFATTWTAKCEGKTFYCIVSPSGAPIYRGAIASKT